MFINLKVLKRSMKEAYKQEHLTIGNVNESLVISTGNMTVQVFPGHATNEYKALIVEYLGALPGRNEVYSVIGKNGNQLTIGLDRELDIQTICQNADCLLERTSVRIGDVVIYQVCGLKRRGAKLATAEKWDAIVDRTEARQEELDTMSVVAISSNVDSIFYCSEEMALKLLASSKLYNSKAFENMAKVDLLGDDDDWEDEEE